MIYAFEVFEVDANRFELRKDGANLNVEKQVFELLLLLVKSPGKVILKDEIIDAVWGGRAISDAAITSRISTLRGALGDSGREQRLIKTIHGQGLRFMGDVTLPSDFNHFAAKPMPEDKRVRTSDTPLKHKRSWGKFTIGAGVGAALLALAGVVSPNVNITSAEGYSPWQLNLPTESYLARDAYLRGVELRDKTNSFAIPQASDQFQIAIDNDPKFAPAYAALASLNAQTHRNDPNESALLKDKADQLLAQAKALDSKSKEVRVAEGEIAWMRRDYGQAQNIADQLIEDFPYFLPAYLLQAKARYELGDIDKVQESLDIAISIAPLSDRVLQISAEAKLANGDYAGSLEAAHASAWWNPNSTRALVTMSRVQLQDAEYEKALVYLERARTQNPLDNAIVYDLIYLYNNLDMLEERDNIARSKMQQSIVQSLNDNGEEALVLIGNLDLEDIHLDTHYFLREYARAAQRFDVYLANRSEFGVLRGQGLQYARMCYVYTRTRSPLQERVCDALAAYYEDKSPEGFALYEDVLGGAGFKLMQDETDAARTWLDVLVQRGHAFMNITDEPVFAKFKTVEGFEALYAQMNENAELHRSHIRGKLND